MLSVNEEKHRLVRIVDNNSSLVLSAQYMQKLFFIVTVMKLKFGLNRPKRLIRFLPPREQETDNFFNIIPRPKNEIHLLSTANYIL